MLFNSLEFPIFFVIVWALYSVLRLRAQNVLLLLASYVFYGCWDWRFLSLIVVSTLVDYWCGLALHAADDPSKRKRLLQISVCTNLGILGFFKYFNFFSGSAAALLARLGLHADPVTLDIVLPVGISFYTFQTMSYTIDVYRGKLAPARSMLDFAVFVAFFPQLVAGPIERAERFLPQVQAQRTITYPMVRDGAWLLLLGFFKKIVVADNVSLIADPVFNDPGNPHLHGARVVIGVLAFAMQIYGDFSGYSDIARGLAKLMGFDLIVNFRMPYFSCNPREFWTRWHISLSSWLRDYLYVPLGGNRGGVLRTQRNLMLTMLLGGLWHGAAWNFVLWGAFHGVLLAGHRMLVARRDPERATHDGLWRLPKMAGFFALVCFGWVLFRIAHVGDLVLLARALTVWRADDLLLLAILAFYVTPLLLIDVFQERRGDLLAVKQLAPSMRLLVYSTLFGYLVVAGNFHAQSFLYFQF